MNNKLFFLGFITIIGLVSVGMAEDNCSEEWSLVGCQLCCYKQDMLYTLQVTSVTFSNYGDLSQGHNQCECFKGYIDSREKERMDKLMNDVDGAESNREYKMHRMF